MRQQGFRNKSRLVNVRVPSFVCVLLASAIVDALPTSNNSPMKVPKESSCPMDRTPEKISMHLAVLLCFSRAEPFVRDEDTRVLRARWTSCDREAHVTDRKSAQACEGKDMAMAAALRGARNKGMDGARRLLSTQTLPDLPYDYSALEPYISAEIMQLHHAKHHQTYVNNFNALAEQYTDAEAKGDVAKMIAMQSGIKFNGGGHVNHSIFWKNLCPASQFEPPTGKLAAAIEESFGGLDALQKKFNPAAAAVQGSGWAWLALHPESKKLQVVTTSNQDPCSTTGHIPLLGVDVWEHAYYLQYKNVRPDYLKAIWNVVNWKDVAERFEKATV